jgi:hypothetical protein
MKTLYYASGPGLGARAVYKKETDDKEIEYTLSYQKPHISYTESRNGEITKGEVGDTAQMIGLYKELTKFINTH